MAETGYFAGDTGVDPLRRSEMCACERVRCSGVAFASRCDSHDQSEPIDVGPLRECLDRLSVCGYHGRISPNVRHIPRRFGQRHHDR